MKYEQIMRVRDAVLSLLDERENEEFSKLVAKKAKIDHLNEDESSACKTYANLMAESPFAWEVFIDHAIGEFKKDNEIFLCKLLRDSLFFSIDLYYCTTYRLSYSVTLFLRSLVFPDFTSVAMCGEKKEEGEIWWDVYDRSSRLAALYKLKELTAKRYRHD